MYWNKELTYWITPKSGPIRSMETLLDANRALSQDLPRTFLKRPHWLGAGALLVRAAETGGDKDIRRATDGLVNAIEHEGWMDHVRAAARTVDFSLVPVEAPPRYGDMCSGSVATEDECSVQAESIKSLPASGQPLDALFTALLRPAHPPPIRRDAA
jgi:hypothetical protein